MRAVGLKVLKNKLSEYVRLAAGGETVLVTDRDKVVAEIVPPRPERPLLAGDAMLADAVRKGHLRPPLISSSEPPKNMPVAKFDELMKELDADREDR